MAYIPPTGLSGTVPNPADPLVGALAWVPAALVGSVPVLLLHYDGTNGATSTVDSSVNAWPVTVGGGATLSTAEFEFGPSSIHMPRVDGIGTGVQVPFLAGGALDIFGSPDGYTISCWFRVPTPGTLPPAYYGYTLFQILSSVTSANVYVQLIDNQNGTGSIGVVNSNFISPGSSTGSATITLAYDTWYHFAFVVPGTGAGAAYLDGASILTLTNTSSYVAPTPGDQMYLRVHNDNGTFEAYQDEFCISSGVLWSANFTPPAQPFTPQGLPPVGYDVYRDGVSIATFSGGPSFTDTVPTIGTYVYTVAAWDGTSDTSALSPPFSLDYEAGIVPNLINTSYSTVAPELLAAAQLTFGTVGHQASGIVLAGNIISQSPAAGTILSVGSGVNVVVSTGLPPLTVPDLFEMTQADATSLLLSLGFVVGAIGSQPSNLIPAGTVMLQNPTAGTPLPPGSIVSFVLSTGNPATSTLFDFEATVISQYANSPTIMQLVANLNQYIDQSANFANFYNYVWNIDSAVGFGLDIWGVIVGVSRLLNIPTGVQYVGFYQDGESQPDQDWTPAGSSQPPYNDPPVGGAMYTGYNATTAYLLPDDAYRQLILAKAFANICTTTAPAINQILQNLYGAGTAYVLNTGTMAISYNLTFVPTPIQLAILEQSGVIPTPPAVAVTINTGV